MLETGSLIYYRDRMGATKLKMVVGKDLETGLPIV